MPKPTYGHRVLREENRIDKRLHTIRSCKWNTISEVRNLFQVVIPSDPSSKSTLAYPIQIVLNQKNANKDEDIYELFYGLIRYRQSMMRYSQLHYQEYFRKMRDEGCDKNIDLYEWGLHRYHQDDVSKMASFFEMATRQMNYHRSVYHQVVLFVIAIKLDPITWEANSSHLPGKIRSAADLVRYHLKPDESWFISMRAVREEDEEYPNPSSGESESHGGIVLAIGNDIERREWESDWDPSDNTTATSTRKFTFSTKSTATSNPMDSTTTPKNEATSTPTVVEVKQIEPDEETESVTVQNGDSTDSEDGLYIQIAKLAIQPTS